MEQEDRFMEIAQLDPLPTVILCDRGVMDCKAYMDEEDWQAVLDEYQWKLSEIRDNRYDGVIHMVTAAEGAEEYYSLENNKARYEVFIFLETLYRNYHI